MKVILNKDLAPLGEEGDVRDVAKGYARNYLFPRGIALPYTESTVKLFESRKDEIEARKAEKRLAAAGLKERLEALEPVIVMPAGANGKLYGAVTSQTVADELAKQGFQIERKRIELGGAVLKNAGKYKVTVKLYESAAAEFFITVEAQVIKTETKESSQRQPKGRRREDHRGQAAAAEGKAGTAPEAAPAPGGAEAAPETGSPGLETAAGPGSGAESSGAEKNPEAAPETAAAPENAAPETAPQS